MNIFVVFSLEVPNCLQSKSVPSVFLFRLTASKVPIEISVTFIKKIYTASNLYLRFNDFGDFKTLVFNSTSYKSGIMSFRVPVKILISLIKVL